VSVESNRSQYALDTTVLPGIQRVQEVGVVGSVVPVTTTISIPSADTEVFYTLAAGTKRFRLQLRSDTVSAVILKLSFQAGESNTNYWSIWPGDTIEEPVLTGSAVTLYFQTTKASQVAELLTWA
jgi:hypothetical protein